MVILTMNNIPRVDKTLIFLWKSDKNTDKVEQNGLIRDFSLRIVLLRFI